MSLAPGTVFVFGAGFTRGIFSSAPLLVDDFHGEELLKKYATLQDAHTILEMEMNHADHLPGRINLERLMTRLAGGMPYDPGTGADKELALLLADLKANFHRRLEAAKASASPHLGDLWLFAGHCIQAGTTCITFNYDDVLDQALWDFSPRHQTPTAWSPDWGYGFPCLMSKATVTNVATGQALRSPMLLLKLHGSANWRIPLGHRAPCTVDAVRHHETWFEHYQTVKTPLAVIDPFLEPSPFIVPPILTKTDLVERPILRLVWSLALDALKNAKRVVFIGYSLPITDIAAGFLFREGLHHLDHARDITIIDRAPEEEQRQEKLRRLLPAYRNVFPKLTETQFEFCGAVDWIRNNLTDWLFDSKGQPIAFQAHGLILSQTGHPIGEIRSYEPGRLDVWNNTCVGKVVSGNRFFFREGEYPHDRGPMWQPKGGLPGVPTVPTAIAQMSLPTGFRDVEIDDRCQ